MFESDVRTTLHPWILNSGFPERMHSTTQRLEWRAFRPSAFDGPRSIPMDFGQCGMLLEIVPVVLCGCYDSPACSFNDSRASLPTRNPTNLECRRLEAEESFFLT